MAEPEKRKYSEAGISENEDDEDISHRVAKAKTYETYEESIPCPVSKVGSVIGPRGLVVKEIMRQTQCKVVVLEARGELPRVLISEGTEENIHRAKLIIERIFEEGNGFIRASFESNLEEEEVFEGDSELIEMDCPLDRVGAVIGSKGVILRELMSKSGAKITLGTADIREGDYVYRRITVGGTPRQVQVARDLIIGVIKGGLEVISELLQGIKPSRSSSSEYDRGSFERERDGRFDRGGGGMEARERGFRPGMMPSSGRSSSSLSSASMTTEMDIPKDRIAVVIGTKGTILNEIMGRTGCKIIINQDVPEHISPKVIFTGTHEQIGPAMVLVSAVMADGPQALSKIPVNQSVQEIPIRASQIGKIMGAQGCIIKEIQQRW